MEYSVDAAANKMILVIVCLSTIIAAGSFVFFRNIEETIPFAIGVAMACGLNVAKVVLLKRSVLNATTKEANAAQLHLQSTYFLRLLLTVAVLLTAGLLHANGGYVNLIGTALGLLVFHVASYSMRYFLREHLVDGVIVSSAEAGGVSSAQDAIDKINDITAGDSADDNN